MRSPELTSERCPASSPKSRAYVGGNWNNDLNCGPFYANLYNSPSNTNTNIGAALSYLSKP
ncbi:hypothetical protein, partial [Faecalibaculum rodentium]|uniref:hypothetical protein n=1 Tax=Faecalibaculum rodentium TaxID=1702221 RepID=UPI0025A9E8EE